jgi:pyridoxal 5'-phosphate synthase pdxT subunit
MDIVVERNAYGRQLDSRVVWLEGDELDAALTGEGGAGMEAVFIRAPIIRGAGEGVRVLARYQDDPVVVEQGRHLAATFHPELSADEDRLHRYFLRKLETA